MSQVGCPVLPCVVRESRIQQRRQLGCFLWDVSPPAAVDTASVVLRYWHHAATCGYVWLCVSGRKGGQQSGCEAGRASGRPLGKVVCSSDALRV